MDPFEEPDRMDPADDPSNPPDDELAELTPDEPMEAMDGGDEGGEPPEPPPPDFDGPEKNLAKLLSKDFLNGLASRAIEADESARKSSEGWREKVADYLRLYNGDVPDAGSMGQENITAMHLPYGKRAVRTYSSKLYAQLYPPSGEIVNLKVRTPAYQAIADKCTMHMNFQLANQIEEYLPSHDRGTPQLMIEGCTFETWWYDPLLKRPAQEISLSDDFAIPYAAKCDRPDMADIPVKTWTKRYAAHQLEALEAEGYYIGVTQEFQHPEGGVTSPILSDPFDRSGSQNQPPDDTALMRETPVKDEADQSQGVEKQSDDPDAPRRILEQDRMVKLPGQAAQRLVTICVDATSTTVLRVSFCEREDAADRKRFNDETAIWQQTVQTAMMAHQEATAQHAAGQVDQFTGEVFPSEGPPPAPPQMPPQPQPVKKVPWHRHTKYDCNPNPEGALGIGLMADIYGHNILANKIATRAVSQMTLSMLPTLIASRQAKWSRQDQQLKLGKITESPLSPQMVHDGAGLKQLTFPPPDPNWYKAVEMSDENCQEITAFNIASGGGGLSGETATESEMRHSNATDNISAIGQRINRARAYSLRNLAYINSETIPDEGVTIYKDGAPVTVHREDYQLILSELEVTFTCDPSFESKPLKEKRAQKLMQAVDKIANMPIGIGVVGVDPATCVGLNKAAWLSILKALDAPAEMLTMIANSPMPQPPPLPGAEGGPPGGPQDGQPTGGAGPDSGSIQPGGPAASQGPPAGGQGAAAA